MKSYKIIFKGYRILYVLDDGRYLLYKNFSFYIGTCDPEMVEYLCEIKVNIIKKFLSYFRLTNRLLRLEPRTVEKLDDEKYVIAFLKQIFVIDITHCTIKSAYKNIKGYSDVLNFLYVEKYKKVYWGDYINIRSDNKINIYSIDKDLKIEVVYQFENHEIKHVHNILYDNETDRFIVMTGDVEKTSGIYLFSSNWQERKILAVGKQIYRAVHGCIIDRELYYPTDAVMEDNAIYKINIDTKSVKKIDDVSGSCIYATENANGFYFSTTVEPLPGRKGLLINKRGKGIKDSYSYLFKLTHCEVKYILKFEKDLLPMRLFQYGCMHFPKGQNFMNDIICYGVALKKVDGKNILINTN